MCSSIGEPTDNHKSESPRKLLQGKQIGVHGSHGWRGTGSSSLARASRYLRVQRSGQPLYGGPVRIPPEDPLDLLIDNEVTLQSDRSCEDGSVLLPLLRPEDEGDYTGERQDIGTLPSLFMQLSPRRLAGGLPLLDLSPRQFSIPASNGRKPSGSVPRTKGRPATEVGEWMDPAEPVGHLTAPRRIGVRFRAGRPPETGSCWARLRSGVVRAMCLEPTRGRHRTRWFMSYSR